QYCSHHRNRGGRAKRNKRRSYLATAFGGHTVCEQQSYSDAERRPGCHSHTEGRRGPDEILHVLTSCHWIQSSVKGLVLRRSCETNQVPLRLGPELLAEFT